MCSWNLHVLISMLYVYCIWYFYKFKVNRRITAWVIGNSISIVINRNAIFQQFCIYIRMRRPHFSFKLYYDFGICIHSAVRWLKSLKLQCVVMGVTHTCCVHLWIYILPSLFNQFLLTMYYLVYINYCINVLKSFFNCIVIT